MTQIISSLGDVADQYDAVFCDLWGCLHNGIAPFPAAVKALQAFRDKGGKVILLTNAPRPAIAVAKQLDAINVSRDLYHGIVASGDAARAALASGAYGSKVYHIGPDRDEGFFRGLENEDYYKGIDIERVALADAEGIVVTGPFDDQNETPEDYRAIFLAAKTRGLSMLCANPDLVVDRGEKRIYCAGALAELYLEMGGTAHYFGKPHAPIYELAYQRLTDIAGQVVEPKKILCIGDGIRTDVRGAISEDLDCLFITGGLAAEDTETTDQPNPQKLALFLKEAQLSPRYAAGFLR